MNNTDFEYLRRSTDTIRCDRCRKLCQAEHFIFQHRKTGAVIRVGSTCVNEFRRARRKQPADSAAIHVARSLFD